MELDRFKLEFNKYIEHSTSRVLLVKGQWGIGKTHYIDSCLNEIKDFNIIKLSMFGVTNIDDITLELSDKIVSTLLSEKGNQVLKTATSIPFISKFLPKNKLNLIDIDSKFTKAIIFFDDLERTSLSLASIFGYIDKIKNNSSFKIVIAMNDEKIKSEGVWELKEKSVDVELRLKSTLGFLVSDIFGDDEELAIRVFKAFNITNLRTVIKSQRTMNYFLKNVKELDEENLTSLKISCLAYSAHYYSLGDTKDHAKNVFRETAGKIHLYSPYFPFNNIIESYLDSQIIEMELLTTINERVIQNQFNDYAKNDYDKLVELLTSSFSSDSQDVDKLCNIIVNNRNSSDSQFLFAVDLLLNLNKNIDLNLVKSRFESRKEFSSYIIKDFCKIFEKHNQTETIEYLNELSIPTDDVLEENDAVENRHAEIVIIINQISHANLEYFKSDVEGFSIDDWFGLFNMKDSFKYINNHIDQIIEIIKDDCGENLREVIIKLSEDPLQSFRLTQVLYVNVIKEVDLVNSTNKSI